MFEFVLFCINIKSYNIYNFIAKPETFNFLIFSIELLFKYEFLRISNFDNFGMYDIFSINLLIAELPLSLNISFPILFKDKFKHFKFVIHERFSKKLIIPLSPILLPDKFNLVNFGIFFKLSLNNFIPSSPISSSKYY